MPSGRVRRGFGGPGQDQMRETAIAKKVKGKSTKHANATHFGFQILDGNKQLFIHIPVYLPHSIYLGRRGTAISIYPWDWATLARMSRLLTLHHSFIFLCHTQSHSLTTFLFLGIHPLLFLFFLSPNFSSLFFSSIWVSGLAMVYRDMYEQARRNPTTGEGVITAGCIGL